MTVNTTHRTLFAIALTATVGMTLAGCAADQVDSTAVTNSATSTDIAATGYCTVDAARLAITAVGTELRLDFTINNANGIEFSPVSTVTFTDGVLVCLAERPRDVPSLVATTDSWDFSCDANEFPDGGAGAAVVVADEYN